ncbi:hypothetical protein [Rubinisphaera margarita]|uniref:hypothetical protein n=1 Tax=Rubinisphaera margarita TaxID=2909586 RepID=UPI001EE91D15|nr:hypothetical protein [Rubinisphaera margarita]
MTVEYRYTKHQVARGTRADAERNDAFFLLKNVTSLRLTYQIRLLTFRAKDTGRKLVIRIPSVCKLHPELRAFQKEHSKTIRIEKV